MKSSLLIGIALFLASSCEKENTLKKVDDVCTKMEDSNFMNLAHSWYLALFYPLFHASQYY